MLDFPAWVWIGLAVVALLFVLAIDILTYSVAR